MPEAFIQPPPLCSYLSLALSLPLFVSISCSLSLVFLLSNGISIGQIATGIQSADRLIESLIGCLMSACCWFTLRETESHFKRHTTASWTCLQRSLHMGGSTAFTCCLLIIHTKGFCFFNHLEKMMLKTFCFGDSFF